MFQLLHEWEARCRTWSYKLSLFGFDIMIMMMAPCWDVTSGNHTCMNTITKGNSWHYQWGTSDDSGDNLWSNHCVITEIHRQAWPKEMIIQSSHHPGQREEPSSSSNSESDITSEEQLKTLLRILSIYYQNYCSKSPLWIRREWVCGNRQHLSTHTRGSLPPSAISLYTITSGVQPTSPTHLHTPPVSKGLDRWCTSSSQPDHCLTKSGPTSDCGSMRQSSDLLFLVGQDIESGKTRSIGQVHRWLYLV